MTDSFDTYRHVIVAEKIQTVMCDMVHVCRGFEVPPCVLSKPDPSRRIEPCVLAFGADSTNAVTAHPPVLPSVSTSTSHAANVAVAGPFSSALASSPHSTKTSEAESTSVPAAVCPGYLSDGDENASTADFPPADLPPDTDEFRIVVTHVDDDCHIYGHAMREGTTLSRFLAAVSLRSSSSYLFTIPELNTKYRN